MELTTYQFEANKTIPSHLNEEGMVDNAVYGIVGEIGEFVDILKKIKFQGHPLDEATRNHLKSELGDVLFYIAEMATGLGFPLNQVAEMNIAKIRARYGDHFDSNKSQNRKEGDI